MTVDADESPLRLVASPALVLLAIGAAVEWREIGMRVAQLLQYHWKFGAWEPITAGREAFAVLSVVALLGALLSLGVAHLATDRTRRVAALVVGVGYLSGLAVWAGMIASPLVYFAR